MPSYLTVAELLRGTVGVNWATIPKRDATLPEQTAAQNEIIVRASDWIITEAGQKLHATLDPEILAINGRRTRRYADGSLFVQLKYSPVIQVTLIEWSDDLLSWTTISPQVVYQNRSAVLLVAGSSGCVPGGEPAWLRITYLNGYPNMLLTADASLGATSLHVDLPTGVRPGDTITIYDSPGNEDVIVAGSYVPGALILPLLAPTVAAHTTGTRLSELLPAIREATLLMCTHYGRERGRDAVTVGAAGTTGRAGTTGTGTAQARDALVDEARKLLKRAMRVI